MRRSLSAMLLVLGSPGVWMAGAVALSTADVACSSESNAPPSGSGDTLTVDVEASAAPPPVSSDANEDPDGIFDPLDGSDIYGSAYDAYAVRTICAPPDAGSSSGSKDGGAKAGTGGDAGSATGDGGSPANGGDGGYATADGGCEPFPAACTAEPDCVCLLNMLASEIPCQYPHCSVDPAHGGFSLYCP